MCLGMELSPLREQYTLLTPEPFLQPHPTPIVLIGKGPSLASYYVAVLMLILGYNLLI